MNRPAGRYQGHDQSSVIQCANKNLHSLISHSDETTHSSAHTGAKFHDSCTGLIGLAAKWRAICKTLSRRDKARCQRKQGSIIYVNIVAPTCIKDTERRKIPMGASLSNTTGKGLLFFPEKPLDCNLLEKWLQKRHVHQSNRLLRREKESMTCDGVRERRLVSRLIETLVSPMCCTPAKQCGTAQDRA